MTWFDYAIFALSGFGATTAALAFGWAVREGHPAMRPVYAAAGALCTLYILSYIAVMFTDLAPADWSKFMRPVSLAFWWVAVVAPTTGAVLIHRGTKRGLAEFVGAHRE